MAVCEALLSQWPSASGKVSTALLSALSALLALSSPATQTALDAGLLSSLVSNLQQTHLTLTVQTSSTDKLKKVCCSFRPVVLEAIPSVSFIILFLKVWIK